METRRLFLAAAVSLLVLVVWQYAFPPAAPVGPREAPITSEMVAAEGDQPALDRVSTSEVPGAPPAGTTGTGAASEQQAARPLIVAQEEQEVELETEKFVARFTNRGARLVSFVLKGRAEPSGEPVDMVRRRAPEEWYPFSLVDAAGAPLSFDQALFEVESSPSEARFLYSGPEGRVEKRFSVSPTSLLGFEVQAEGVAGWSLGWGPGLRNPSGEELSSRLQKGLRQASWLDGDDVGKAAALKGKPGERIAPQSLRWAAVEDRYFLAALLPSTPVRDLRVFRLGSPDGLRFRSIDRLEAEPKDGERAVAISLEPVGSRIEGLAYLGPKAFLELRKLPGDLQRSVRLGVFSFVAKPLLFGLHWLFDHVVANYGWCIVLMTGLIKVVLLPLTHRSQQSMLRMQRLNPKMEAIRQKFRPKLRDKNGRPNLEMQRKMNEEMQGLFKQEGVNPAAGCLPLLLQMPVFFGFYQLLSQAVELWGAPWVGWIHDLSGPDPIWVLPLVMGATQLLQNRMMPASPNATQRIILNTMPVWFTVLALSFPAGLVLYWLTNNVLTIIQQAVYKRLRDTGVLAS